ncbi:MAG: MMPL family transporter [Alphaproteobacteria bacterium]|nr:MMPL family transporter [Alphaproteobacteria bacterium]
MTATLERLVFDNRIFILIALALVTVTGVYGAGFVRFDAALEKQLPVDHPYIETVLAFRDKIPGLNAVNIVVETREGSIWTKPFLRKLNDVTQDVSYVPGILRESVTSFWTPNTRVYEATEGAVDARNLIPSTVTPESLTDADVARIRDDALKGGFRGVLFAPDFRSAMITAAIQEVDPQTGKAVDVFEVATKLERQIRAKYENETTSIRMIGFAPFIGEVAREARDALWFFVVAFAITTAAALVYTRSLVLAGLAVGCSFVSLIWQFGVIGLSGLGLNPLVLIIPFLAYAIGVSHGVQQINLIASGIAKGLSPYSAARASFRRLLWPGGSALITALVGFLALVIVPIPMVEELAIIAAIGVAMKLVSNLVMLPVIASFLKFSDAEIERQADLAAGRHAVLRRLAPLAEPRQALIGLCVGVILMVGVVWLAGQRVIGDVAPGAPELWPSARYNQDASFLARNYSSNLDLFVVVVETPPDACVDHTIMRHIERFGVEMRAVPGVKSVQTLPEVARMIYSIVLEGNLKWRVLPKDPTALVLATSYVPVESGLLNKDCTLLPVAIYLDDHKAETITTVAAAAQAFAARSGTTVAGKPVKYHFATGNAAIYGAMNDSIAASEWPALAIVFGVIAVLVFAAFQDWRAVICCCMPLLAATYVGYALMAALGIGLKFSTLPVLVVAVGIGVDYAFYIYARLMVYLRDGADMAEAYVAALRETGMAVIFTGLTLAGGAASWAFSGLKFQADMGLLLAFLFLANMIGAVTLLPALATMLDALVPRARPKR